VQTTFTPRRLVLIASELQTKQDDLDIVKSGPSRKIAYKEDGSPAPALEGFLRSSQASLNDVYWQDNGKGEVACVRIKQTGVSTSQLLPLWIESILRTIPFPKKMQWGGGGLAFARPIRWLVCLWGQEILSLNAEGLKSGRKSFGNRFAGLEISVEIPEPNDYYTSLKTINVVADRQERYETIRKQLLEIFQKEDYSVDLDEGLLQTVTDLVEFPTAVIAEFEEKFLVLPAKIITSTISQNQKYFAVNDKYGNLSNKFIFISNGNPDYNELIRKGNEKVVKPRLEDAMWYYQEDTKHKLDEYVSHLEDVVFQADLSTLKAKTDRIVELASHLGQLLNLPEKDISLIKRTAMLCKADLVTKMLGEKEFTKLQGYIGMHYALASGEPDEVAKGIYEHYMPRGQNDELPSTLTGSIVAVSDKLDTVCGIIGIGMLPTGSADPFALRRAANGIVQIIAERKWDVEITDLIDFSLGSFNRADINSDKNKDIIRNYFHQRVNWYLQQLQIDYDVIESVMHINFGNLLHLVQRAKALQVFKANEDFVKLVIGFKRVSNIIKDEKQQLIVDDKLFAEPSETALHLSLLQLDKDIKSELDHLNYTGVLEKLVAIRSAIDKFFDDVLVNIEDEKLRKNRYALLQAIRRAFLQVADLSLLVVEGK
jgi:glycyl-tRNA synthetase beta chain